MCRFQWPCMRLRTYWWCVLFFIFIYIYILLFVRNLRLKLQVGSWVQVSNWKHGLVTCFWNAIACHGSIIFHLSSVQILILTSHLFWHNPFSFPSVPFVKTAAEPYLHRKIAAALSDLQCALTFEHLIHLCIQQLPPQAICCDKQKTYMKPCHGPFLTRKYGRFLWFPWLQVDGGPLPRDCRAPPVVVSGRCQETLGGFRDISYFCWNILYCVAI